LELASLVEEYEKLLQEAKRYCERVCAGRERCFRKCLEREKLGIREAIEQKFGIVVEVI